MYIRFLSLVFAALSIITAALFTGYSLAGDGQAAEASLPVLTLEVPPQTEAPPKETETAPPEVTEPERDILAENCALAAGEMDGTHIFVWDPENYRMLFSQANMEAKLYPASITKLYTAYLALMYLEPDQVITAGAELKLVHPGSSTAYIARGHRLRVDMLIEAMLLPSGNDAAYVLAAAAGRIIAGDKTLDAEKAVAAFVAEMNQEAFRLGLSDTNFVNPDGWHDPNHYTSAQDAAVFSSLAMGDPVIRKYAGMCADAVTFESGEVITWYNTNRLVNPSSQDYCPNAIGAKTGFTSEAGYCLVAVFREGQQELVVGIFGSQDPYSRYNDAVTLWQICKEGKL